MSDVVFLDSARPVARRGSAPTHFPAVALTAVTVQLVICSSLLLAWWPREGALRTLGLLWVVSLFGAALIVRASRRLGDRKLLRLVTAHAVKLVVIFIILIAGWLPTLDPQLPSFGYDPQRYYFDAQALREAHFDKAAVPSLNYAAVYYLYALEFLAFGHNAFAPALVNALLTLLATLLLTRVVYRIRQDRHRWDWTVGLALLIPDVVWFDALTARDGVSMVLFTVGVLGTAAYAIIPAERKLHVLLAGIVALFLLSVVRTAAFVPALAALVVVYLTSRMSMRRRAATISILIVALGAIAVGPGISERLGSTRFDLWHELDITTKASEGLETEEFQWSEHSVGRALTQHSLTGVLLLSPVRMVAYLVAPLPVVNASFSDLAAGEWEAWQYLFLAAGALIYVVLLPCAIAGTIDLARKRLPSAAKVVIVPFWITLFAVAVGNQIIHERYRLLAVLFLWGTVWFGFRSERRTLLLAHVIWFAVLIAGAAVYGFEKFMA